MSSIEDQQTILGRLARVAIIGLVAREIAASADPTLIRQISDADVARIYGGVIAPMPLYPQSHLYPS